MKRVWTTHLPAALDNPVIDQPDLTNDTYPGAGDGDLTDNTQIHAVRDIANYCANQIGSDLQEPGTLRHRVTDLENAHLAFTDLSDVPLSYSGCGGQAVIVKMAEDGLEFGAGSGGGSDRVLLFADDTEMAEAGTSWVTKKRFRVVRDSDKPFLAYRFIVGLKTSVGVGESILCRALVLGALGIGNEEESSWTAYTGTTEAIRSFNLRTIDPLNEPEDTAVEIQIQIEKSGGSGTGVSIIFTEVWGLYVVPPLPPG